MRNLGITTEDLALCLRANLLSACSPDLFSQVISAPSVCLCTFPAGTAVYDPTHFRRCLGVLLEGELTVTKGELSVSVLGPGDLFGAAALYSDAPQFATTITAKKDSRCLLLPQDVIDELIARDPGFRDRYLRYLTGRIHFLSARLDSLAQHGAEGKLGRYLLSNAEQQQLTCSATDLARRLGLSRATLYRAFEVLERDGLILRQGKTITIPNPAALQAACD